jgi:hypothetical protein
MSEHPILFCGELVRANHAGLKWVTRRLSGLKKVNADPGAWEIASHGLWEDDGWCVVLVRRDEKGKTLTVKSPFGGPGHTIWTRETGAIAPKPGKPYDVKPGPETHFAVYRADCSASFQATWKWKPSIHMPRWVSRDSYKVLSARCERLQDITDEDARAEGVNEISLHERQGPNGPYYSAFADLWDKINAARGYPWEMNPWVWRIEYLNPAAVEKGNQKEEPC